MTGGAAIRTALAAVCAAFASAAMAQESPELPAKELTAGQPSGGEPLRFTKGKGPGRGNSYLARFEEDYGYLRDPARASDVFDPLKFITIDPDRESWLTLNGETRFRYDNTDHRNFAVATAATPAKKPGGLPSFTPATGTSTNQLYKQRYALGGDLHLGANLRFYTELMHGQQTGHNVGQTIPGNQRNELGLVNGFGELYAVVDAAKTGLRAGRQQVYLGNNLQVRANVSTNLPSPVFDGFRAYRDWGFARIDGFAFNLVRFNDGLVNDLDISHTNLWGVYGSYDVPKLALAGIELGQTLEPFYLGWRSGTAAGGRGSGMYNDQALLTGARVVAATGAGFVASQDHRHTLGLRAYGRIGPNVDYDWQGAYQIGSYAGLRVDAFAFNTDSQWINASSRAV